jgi:hypothetical protein
MYARVSSIVIEGPPSEADRKIEPSSTPPKCVADIYSGMKLTEKGFGDLLELTSFDLISSVRVKDMASTVQIIPKDGIARLGFDLSRSNMQNSWHTNCGNRPLGNIIARRGVHQGADIHNNLFSARL